ncbi:MAG: ABC transporter ATP-binding protein [Chloroflexi bacterium]|nr:ABC transporter ATP-binding protein [Chloroflexota bacterium]MCL5075296.1 ABC transporter ATP-binding protein [Chloroflexota bacterium]
MSEMAIQVEGLSKRYRIGELQRYKALRDTLTDAMYAPFRAIASALNGRQSPVANRQPDTYIWALKDISLEIDRGEVAGIIGRNGAGKSTFLKILSRITEPTEGYAVIHGRVGSLLEVGTGFHPELTGRENVYLNGAILGMRKTEIERKFAEIVSFAEVEKFIDTPVKFYSSGMYVRLAFAVAAHLEPEILLVDEVLAVGDIAFQQKCLGKMGDVARGGRTILFVSHNMAAISALCSKAYLLHQGHISASGPVQTVIEQYLNEMKLLAGVSLNGRTDRQGDGKMRLTEVVIRDGAGDPIELAVPGQDITIEIYYAAQELAPLRNVSMAIGLYGILGQFLLFCGNEMVGEPFEAIPPKGKMICRIPRFPLAPGRYALNLHCEVNGVLADWVQQASYLTVAEGDFFGSGRLPPSSHGGLLVPHTWSCEGE